MFLLEQASSDTTATDGPKSTLQDQIFREFGRAWENSAPLLLGSLSLQPSVSSKSFQRHCCHYPALVTQHGFITCLILRRIKLHFNTSVYLSIQVDTYCLLSIIFTPVRLRFFNQYPKCISKLIKSVVQDTLRMYFFRYLLKVVFTGTSVCKGNSAIRN